MNHASTILVAEDEGFLREAIAFDLTLQGFKVLEASNGRIALEMIRQEHPRLVISDIRMPEMSGIELLRQLRLHDPFLPVVVFLTGYADLSREEAYALGADAVFSKPFDRKELFEAIQRLMQAPAVRWALHSHTPDLPLLQGRVGIPRLGRGGFLIEASQNKSLPGQRVRLEIQVDGMEIRGEGEIKWNQQGGRQGVEILSLEPASLEWMLGQIQELRPRAYIPMPETS